LKPLSLGFALVLMAAVGCAHNSPDVQGNTTAESGNPNSVLSKNDPGPAPTDSATYQGQLGSAERSNPNAVQNKDRAPVPPPDPQLANEQARAAEQGAPDSVDDRLPSPPAILQRLHAFDRVEMRAGRLAMRSGGTNVAAYGQTLIDDSHANELMVADLAMKMRIQIDEQSINDPRAKKIISENEDAFTRIEAFSGGQFDRAFARHMNKEQRHELEMVQSLRSRTVDPKINAILDGMMPKLGRSIADADALTAAVAEGDPRP
jgi:predicted outer membrane protein